MASKGDLIAKLKSTPAAQLKAGLKAANMARNANLYQIMKFDGKSGLLNHVISQNNEKRLPEGMRLAFDVFGSMQGFICWNGGEVVGEYYKSFFETLPDIATMEDHGPYDDPEKDGWQHSYVLFFKQLDTNTQWKCNISSASGRRAVDGLYQRIGDLEAMHDFVKETPIVVIGAEPFTARGFKNYKPVFEIVEWIATPIDKPVVNPLDQKALPPVGGAPAPKGDSEDSVD